MIGNDYFGRWNAKVLKIQFGVLFVEVLLSFYYAFVHREK